MKAGEGPRVFDVLLEIVRRPQLLLLQWNWKSAIFSAAYRCPIFFVASVRHGLKLALAGTLVEAAFNAFGAGVYGTFLQGIRKATPAWLAVLVGTCLLPAAFQILEFLFHLAIGTYVLRRGIAASIAMSILSAMFNMYAMRRGILLVGAEGKPFRQDLAKWPVILRDFFLLIPRWVGQRVRPRSGKFMADVSLNAMPVRTDGSGKTA
ncbi:MAG TPA: hypothetical protein VKZ53_23160 [Candidatus Angelobacter sp.]|nr:hypothetical protein [Candidatus Angelobacter sp.]